MGEGWTYLYNSTKWHYFRGKTSLCGKFMLLGNSELAQGNDRSKDNCRACMKKLGVIPAPQKEHE